MAARSQTVGTFERLRCGDANQCAGPLQTGSIVGVRVPAEMDCASKLSFLPQELICPRGSQGALQGRQRESSSIPIQLLTAPSPIYDRPYLEFAAALDLGV